jgi:hypothetical protein
MCLHHLDVVGDEHRHCEVLWGVQECVRRRLWTGERLLSRGGPELLSLATVLEYVVPWIFCESGGSHPLDCVCVCSRVVRYPASVAGIATRPGLDPTVSALATEIHKMF